MAIFDFENMFGEDYLHFYGPELTPERNARDRVNYDLRTERTCTERITVRDGKVRRSSFSVRLYGFVDLTRLLGAAGLGTAEGFGRNGEPLTLYGRRLIVVSEKTDGNARMQSV